MQELTPGLELGARFVLVRRIGRGGSAEVWLAADRDAGGEVALKFFDESVTGDAARLARLEAEVGARGVAAARARRSRSTASSAMDGRTFLVMEYLEGGDLGQLRGRSFESWSRAVDDVAAALEALHARGLVHRDLKCANVFLDGDGPRASRRLRPRPRSRAARSRGIRPTTRARSSCAASPRSPRTTSTPSARCSTS